MFRNQKIQRKFTGLLKMTSCLPRGMSRKSLIQSAGGVSSPKIPSFTSGGDNHKSPFPRKFSDYNKIIPATAYPEYQDYPDLQDLLSLSTDFQHRRDAEAAILHLCEYFVHDSLNKGPIIKPYFLVIVVCLVLCQIYIFYEYSRN